MTSETLAAAPPQASSQDTSATNARPIAPSTLEVDAQGGWFVEPMGRTVELRRTRVMRRVVAALVQRWVENRGEPIPTDELFKIGWAAENISPASAHSRVYMAMCRLRGLGLSGIVVNMGAGYMIEPSIDVRIHGTPAAQPS